MCLCCLTKAKTIRKDILPGYNLLKGMIDHPDWPLGYYALQRWNDPDFVFREIPRMDPSHGVSLKKNEKAYKAYLVWAKEVDDMEDTFECSPELGYILYKACLKAGWRPKRDGLRLVYWLRHHMGKKMKRQKI